MEKTDRQTDKATHWKTALFDKDDNWAKLETLPGFVKQVHRQKEVCPTTGNPHYQIHVECHTQQRLTALTKWLKATKWFAVLGAEHIANSIAYCSKTDTAVPGTQEILKGEKYLRIHELLLEVGRAFHSTIVPLKVNLSLLPSDQLRCIDEYEKQFLFKNASRKLIQSKGLVWIDKLSNPVIEKMWNYFHKEILQEIYKEQLEGPFIIEGPVPPSL